LDKKFYCDKEKPFMNLDKYKNLYSWGNSVWEQPNAFQIPYSDADIIGIKNDLINLSNDIKKIEPYFSNELFIIKDNLFSNYFLIAPIFGRLTEILRYLDYKFKTQKEDMWTLIHPRILQVAKQLYLDNHFSDAVEDSFKEIAARVRKLFSIVRPEQQPPTSEYTLMTTVFSENSPLLKFCKTDNDTGKNIQRGYMNMLAGSMAGIRNPKAHTNDIISSEDAMRKLMYASMLMHKIDEAVVFSNIAEK